MTRDDDKATGRVRATGEEQADLRKMPREDAVAYVLSRYNVSEDTARLIVAMHRGETKGDAFITRSDEA